MKKDLLGLEKLSKEDIVYILEQAKEMKKLYCRIRKSQIF